MSDEHTQGRPETTIASFLAAVGRYLKQTKEELGSRVLESAFNGWYLDKGIAVMVTRCDEVTIEVVAAFFFKDRAKEMIDTISSRFPHRLKPLKQGLDAYESGFYAPAALLFISQADGICQEITGKNAFGKDNKMPANKDWANGRGGTVVDDAFLQLITEHLPSTFKMPGHPRAVNRNEVMHNDQKSTEEECLKALSMLWFYGDYLYGKWSKAPVPLSAQEMNARRDLERRVIELKPHKIADIGESTDTEGFIDVCRNLGCVTFGDVAESIIRQELQDAEKVDP